MKIEKILKKIEFNFKIIDEINNIKIIKISIYVYDFIWIG